jgi:hypothetical protein
MFLSRFNYMVTGFKEQQNKMTEISHGQWTPTEIFAGGANTQL